MRRIILLVAPVALVAAFSASQACADSVVNVTPANMNGWTTLAYDSNYDNPIPPTGNSPASSPPYFYNSTNDGVSFVAGPTGQPIGTGSANLYLLNGTGDGNAVLATNFGAGTPLSSITSLSYYTYSTQNNGQQFPFLRLNINLEGEANGPVDDSLFFEPPYQTPGSGNPSLPNQGATSMNTWQSWNAETGGWWDNLGIFNPGTTEGSNLGVGSLSNFLTALASYVESQNGGVLPADYDPVLTSGSTNSVPRGAISFNVGESSQGDSYNGYVDDFTIGINGVDTTYNFDPSPAPEPAEFVGLIGMAGVGLILIGRRRRPRMAVR